MREMEESQGAPSWAHPVQDPEASPAAAEGPSRGYDPCLRLSDDLVASIFSFLHVPDLGVV